MPWLRWRGPWHETRYMSTTGQSGRSLFSPYYCGWGWGAGEIIIRLAPHPLPPLPFVVLPNPAPSNYNMWLAYERMHQEPRQQNPHIRPSVPLLASLSIPATDPAAHSHGVAHTAPPSFVVIDLPSLRFQAAGMCAHRQPRGSELPEGHGMCRQLCMGQQEQHDIPGKTGDFWGGGSCIHISNMICLD